jgi:metal-responsive CopG/Arc/MetJ family transcriptional regulator
MKKSIKVPPKKRGRGRPPTGGRDPHVTVRMPQTLIDDADAWAAANDTVRSEAIRRLVELGLASGKKIAKLDPRALKKASKAIDSMASDLRSAQGKIGPKAKGK